MLSFKFFDQITMYSPAELDQKISRLEDYYDLEHRDGGIFLRSTSLRPPFWTCAFNIVNEANNRGRLIVRVVPHSIPGAIVLLTLPPILLALAIVRPDQRTLTLIALAAILVFTGLDMILLIWSFRKWLKQKVGQHP